jgi:lipoprotein-anchoring transpeptidase ErfK/SrfK
LGLGTAKVNALTTTQVSNLSSTQFVNLDSSQVIALSAAQLNVLDSTALQAIETTDLQAVTTTTLLALNGEQLNKLSTDGVQALTTGFGTGDALLGVASISAHTFTVSRNGEVLRSMPASMGKPTRPTPIGNFSALEKQRSVVMDSRTIGIPLSSPEGYKITAQYAVRVTWGGVYVHSAPWSIDSQGNSNVSHGCINLSPDNAAWYFNEVNVGDPINVVG